MIAYTFIFTELPDGTFKIHWESPPSNDTTAKEQIFAKNFSGLCRKIFQEIKQQIDGVIITEN